MADVERLLAAITETEQDARACAGAPWVDDVPGMVQVDPAAIRENKQALGRLGYVAHTDNSPAGDAYRAHIVRNDPAVVLRRCAADRNAIGRCQAAIKQYERGDGDAGGYTLAFMVLTHLAEGYGIVVADARA